MRQLKDKENSGIFYSMKRIYSLFVLFGFLVSIESIGAFGVGNEVVNDFFSPSFLATGASLTSLGSPYADIVNPSASGATQRVTLDASYLGIAGSENDFSGYGGHAVNLGITVPTRYGVFSGSGHFFASEYEETGEGGLGLFYGSFAKDITPELLVGAGLSTGFGTDGFFEAGLSLGFINFPQHADFLKDFRWGASFTNIGYVKDVENFPFSSPFTLAAGVGGSLLQTEDFVVDVHADMSFPAFQNVRSVIGAEVSFKDFLFAGIATRLDAREMADGDFSSLVPSFGISFKLKTEITNKSEFLKAEERGWSRSEIKTTLSAVPLDSGLWAFGTGVNMPLGVIDRTPPEIKIDLGKIQSVESSSSAVSESYETTSMSDEEMGKAVSKASRSSKTIQLSGGRKESTKSSVKTVAPPEREVVKYISPNNDGVKDDIVIPLSITDSRYIKGWVLTVTDESGTVVRKIENKEERPENKGVSGFFERLFAVKGGITVPESVRWDGTADDGVVVPDGSYWFHVESWDDNGNVGKTPEYGVVVDNTPPSISIEDVQPKDMIFSPNGDGNKDTLEIKQSGSVEDQWKGSFSNSEGKAVRSVTYTNASPASLAWDGRDDVGARCPDGVYGYRISATDRAGNSAFASLENIILNTEETPIKLSIDRSYFSPGPGGGVLNLIPDVPNTNGIETWSLEIVKDETVVKVFSGAKRAPSRTSFDGTDDSGKVLPEGVYSARLRVVYANGNSPEAVSPRFFVDTTPPQVTVTADAEVFSPNGDGKKDLITFYQETSLEDSWTGKIRNESGSVVRDFSWVEKADPSLVWDGRGKDGLLLPDGYYTYTLEAVDRAGNQGISSPVRFRLDTEETPVILSVEYDAFSPNADGIRDTIKILPEVKKPDGIESYALVILNADATAVRTFTGKGRVPTAMMWDGLSDRGLKVPDGSYQAKLSVRYVNGNEPVSLSKAFLIDTVYPAVKASIDTYLFSPDGDGNKDQVTISHESSEEALWEGSILDAAGNSVWQQFFKGRVPKVVWDGLDEAGNRVPDGSYRWIIQSTDAAGNSGKAEVAPIRIDTRLSRLFLTMDVQAFAPNGDGRFEAINFTPMVTLKEGVSSWRFEIVDSKGNAVWSTEGGDRLPELITWNGKNSEGRVIEGEYRAHFIVTYEKGNRPEVTSIPFLLDVSPPETSLSISPKPFSPDNDGIDDELTIRIGVKDASRIESWNLKIFDPQKSLFTEFAGTGIPTERIIWDGKGRFSELVYSAEDYPVILTVQDVLGNVAVVRDTIPVDVLVLRDGDKLKIQIANINFAPNSSEFETSDPAIVERNTYVLKRLAVILNKYKSYRVTIEGHAVITRFADPKAAEKEQNEELLPLSKARAETVRDELVRLGVSKDRLSVTGVGGAKPLVPHSDLQNRWKNRRVEFILEK